MRRIVVAVMGTLSGLVLLFSYHTSTNQTPDLAAGVPTPATPGDATTSADPTAPADPTTSDDPTTPADPTPSTSAAEPSPATSAPTATPSPPSSSSSSSSSSGTFTGTSVDTRWGPVQVRITVSDGKVTASEAVVYPQRNGRDEEINAYALPVLSQEVVTAQGARIDAVSGATVTSDGYIESLQSALDQAHL